MWPTSISSNFISYNGKDKSNYKRIKIVFNKTVNPFSPSILHYWILHYNLCFEEMS